MGDTIPMSERTADSAWYSWTKPMVVLITSTAPMTIASARLPIARVTTSAATST